MKQIDDIPVASNKTLLIAMISAVIISVLTYFVVILPAEFSKDPTGLGEKFGLMVLSKPSDDTIATPTKINLANKAKDDSDSFEFREDAVTVLVPANKGVEYKFNLKEFGNLTYEWKTNDSTDIYFDFHGEPTGDTTGYFESFTIATTKQMQGSATVPFDGSHGWYWKNTTNHDVTIELKTSGNYQVIGLK